jgi:hypothetical protein
MPSTTDRVTSICNALQSMSIHFNPSTSLMRNPVVAATIPMTRIL